MSIHSVVTMGYQPAGSISLVTTLGYALTGVLPASAALSGTIVPSATEDAIRAGGQTIVITLTNDTWVAAGATFDAIRQDIIDGLVSAQSEPTGWNTVVTGFLPVTAVVRTSDSVVTITLPAFPAYDITSPETITDTVPASAVTAGNPLVASPAFEITVVTPPAPPDATPRFGGGPFWRRGYCDWTKEDERKLEKLEKEERDVTKRLAKAQRQYQRGHAAQIAGKDSGEFESAARVEAQGRRIEALTARLEYVEREIARMEEEREEAEFFDCVTTILLEDEE